MRYLIALALLTACGTAPNSPSISSSSLSGDNSYSIDNRANMVLEGLIGQAAHYGKSISKTNLVVEMSAVPGPSYVSCDLSGPIPIIKLDLTIWNQGGQSQSIMLGHALGLCVLGLHDDSTMEAFSFGTSHLYSLPASMMNPNLFLVETGLSDGLLDTYYSRLFTSN